MAKTKRNKAYKPRPVNPQAMNWALSGAHTLPMHKQVELIGYVDVALDRLRQGRAARDDWNTLANGMNIVKRLVKDFGRWFLVSDNPDQKRYHRQECTGATCIIIGRVVLLQRENV